MANKNLKNSSNVAGKFYIDSNCIGCCQCVDIAGDCFAEDSEGGVVYVKKQPQNEAQQELCVEAMNGCPVGAIGDDGE